jgi:Flp pilus assembly protein TadG
MGGSCARARAHRERGAVAVEFALIMPIFLLLVFGMIQYGVYFWSAQGGSSASREAARRAAVGDLATCAAFRAYVRDRIDSLGDAATASIGRTYQNGPGNLRPTVEVGDVVTVVVEFRSPDFHLPLIPFVNDGVVRQTAEARVENVPSDAVEACPA